MSTFRINWPKWDRLVNDRFTPLVDNKDRYLLLWGGRGSSKSVFVAKKLIFRCLSEKYFRYILIRNQYNSIKDSQYQTIKDIVYELGLEQFFEFKISPLEINCINGNKFLARGCDDTTKLKSIKDPTGCWWEEDIPTEADFITVTTSIRTNKAHYLQEIFSFNPEVEGDYTQNWFWKRFFEGKHDVNFSSTTKVEVGPDQTIDLSYTSHHSTYEDNRWISLEFVAFLKELKQTNPYYYTIYCLGQWGNKQTDGQFYKLFSYAKNGFRNKIINGKPEAYKPDLPLHISFDFNVNPYMTCTVWQLEGKRARQIDEICLSTPNNRTASVCQEFIRRYQGHVGGVFVYGDPAGMHEDTRTEKGYNDFVIIRNELNVFRPTLRLHSAAPPVKMRGDFINTIFQTGYEGVEIFIGYNCTHSINDCLYLKEAPDGTKLKEKTKNPETGVTYEKYGHCFTGGTLVETISGPKRIDSIEAGDWVLTRKGYKRVLQTHDNGLRTVRTYRIGARTLTCTGDHLVWTEEGGFTPIGQLSGSATFCILNETVRVWRSKLLSIVGLDSRDTQQQLAVQTGSTLQVGSGSMDNRKKKGFTALCGSAKKGLFRPATTSIMRTITHSITVLKTLNASLLYNTIGITTLAFRKSIKTERQKYLQLSLRRKQRSGTSQRLDENGIGNMPQKAFTEILKQGNVSNAAHPSPIPSFVAQNIAVAGVRAARGQECFEQKERVYDITVEDEHEYFANGVLVHNCSDSLDYLITMAFAAEFARFQRGGMDMKITLGKNVSKHKY